GPASIRSRVAGVGVPAGASEGEASLLLAASQSRTGPGRGAARVIRGRRLATAPVGVVGCVRRGLGSQAEGGQVDRTVRTAAGEDGAAGEDQQGALHVGLDTRAALAETCREIDEREAAHCRSNDREITTARR